MAGKTMTNDFVNEFKTLPKWKQRIIALEEAQRWIGAEAQGWMGESLVGVHEIIRIALMHDVVTPPLFNMGRFNLSAGGQSRFKIDCDALTELDIAALAAAIGQAAYFSEVIGIPTGGNRLAEALVRYRSPEHTKNVLIVDDVLTTGRSMERKRHELLAKDLDRDVFGWVIFARSKPANWIKALFTCDELYIPNPED
jgi:hypothetical protein